MAPSSLIGQITANVEPASHPRPMILHHLTPCGILIRFSKCIIESFVVQLLGSNLRLFVAISAAFFAFMTLLHLSWSPGWAQCAGALPDSYFLGLVEQVVQLRPAGALGTLLWPLSVDLHKTVASLAGRFCSTMVAGAVRYSIPYSIPYSISEAPWHG